MKIKGLVLTVLAMTGMLVGCGPNDNNPGPVEPKEFPTIDTWDPDRDYIAPKGASIGEFLLEIENDRLMTFGHSYTILFDDNHPTDKSLDITFWVDDLLTVSSDPAHPNDPTYFILTPQGVGDTVIEIRNKDPQPQLIYRNILRVRKPIELNKMDEFLYSVDRFATPEIWQPYLGYYQISFNYEVIYDNKLMGTLLGGDDYDPNVKATFFLKYVEFTAYDDLYIFSIDIISVQSIDTLPKEIYLSRAGDFMVLKNYDDSLLSFLAPIF